jgi:hypothetical protein
MASDTKLKIEELKQQFAQNGLITTSELVGFYMKFESMIPRSTVNWRVSELVKQGVLERIGKGKFKIGKSRLYQPEITTKLFKINKAIRTNFPFVTYCLWQQQWINEFSQHIAKIGVILVEVERDSAESIYHFLKDSFSSVFYKTGKEMVQEYVQGLESALIVKPLVSEAPIQEVRGVPTVSIEKLLVDVHFDTEFEYAQGQETVYIFENAFSRYSVNQTKLLRYADRKKKKQEVIELISSLNLGDNSN